MSKSADGFWGDGATCCCCFEMDSLKASAFARDGDMAMFMFDGDRGIRGETPAVDRAMMKVFETIDNPLFQACSSVFGGSMGKTDVKFVWSLMSAMKVHGSWMGDISCLTRYLSSFKSVSSRSASFR